MDHLTDPEIVRHFEWDAQKISRYNGEGYDRIYSEPWTGKRFWDVQVTAPISIQLKTALTDSDLVITAGGGETVSPRTLCRQVKAFVVRLAKRLSYYGEDPQPPGKDEERRGSWGSARGRVASSGTCAWDKIFATPA
jgi:hypothetical protein